MGYFSYENHEVEFDDRMLAHLHVVIINKLRHGESFAFSWKDASGVGGGRTCVWIHPGSNIRFHFAGSRAPVLNRDWLAHLSECADSSRGLIAEEEPPATPAGSAPSTSAPAATRTLAGV